MKFFSRVDREGKDAGRKASKRERESAIKAASAEIDKMFAFKGTKADPRQETEWPRVDVEGVGPDEIPDCVTQATYFLTGALLAGYQIGPANLEMSRQLARVVFAILEPVIEVEADSEASMPVARRGF